MSAFVLAIIVTLGCSAKPTPPYVVPTGFEVATIEFVNCRVDSIDGAPVLGEGVSTPVLAGTRSLVVRKRLNSGFEDAIGGGIHWIRQFSYTFAPGQAYTVRLELGDGYYLVITANSAQGAGGAPTTVK